MTKRMRELLLKIEQHNQAAKSYLESESPDTEKAAAELEAADELQKQYDLLERLEKAEKAGVPAPTEEEKADTVNGFGILAKLMRSEPLSEKELQAVAMEKSAQVLISGTNAAHGENYLCPEDVDTEIRELRKTYMQASEYITVEETTALSGYVVFSDEPNAGLVNFDDGDTLDDNSAPTFSKKTFTIAWYGAFIPVSQILEDAQKANLIGYLNRWFVKRAIISENTKIFATLKAGYNSGTPKAITGVAGLKSSINKDLDPACFAAGTGVILTNQDGYDCLDSEVDGNGIPVLQPDITNPSIKRFKGLPVIPFPTAQLPNISSGHFPIIYGDLKAGAIMKRYKDLLISVSPHAGWTKVQTLMRALEGFDVISADTSAYIYGNLTATA